MWNEDKIMIWDNKIRNFVKSNNIIEKYLSELRRDDGFNARNEMIYLDKSIDEYENIIIFIRDWKIDDEIVNDIFSEIDRDRKRSKFVILEISWNFISRIKIVYRNIFLDVYINIREIVIV